MKVKCEIIMDLESGEYSIGFNNLSSPGEDIEYTEVVWMLDAILKDYSKTIYNTEDDETITKLVH